MMPVSKSLSCFVSGLLLVFACQLAAAQDQAKLDRLLFTCKSCHGVNLEGKYPNHVPALAGQLPSYLAEQLTQYRSGNRGAHLDDVLGQQMALMTATLDDEEIQQLSQYISALEQKAGAAQLCKLEPTEFAAASETYRTCVACHGDHGEGNSALRSPNLVILHPSYISRQLVSYQHGYRAGSSDAIAMQAIARGLTKQDIQLLSDYLCVLSTESASIEGAAGRGGE